MFYPIYPLIFFIYPALKLACWTDRGAKKINRNSDSDLIHY